MNPEVEVGLLIININISNIVYNIRSGHRGIGLRSQIHYVYETNTLILRRLRVQTFAVFTEN